MSLSCTCRIPNAADSGAVDNVVVADTCDNTMDDIGVCADEVVGDDDEDEEDVGDGDGDDIDKIS